MIIRWRTWVLIAAVGMALAGWSQVIAGPASRPGAVSSVPALVAYQGRVTIDGAAAHGDGRFKFAILDGSTTVWSNDGTVGEPTASVTLPVTNGVFGVLLGDTSLTGMTAALTPAVFNAPDRVLRVWFAPGGGSFSLLSPDTRLASVPYAMNADTIDGIDVDSLQRRVSGTCPADSAIRVVASDGTVTCQATLASVTTGSGLSGAGTLASPLAVTSSTVQTRVSGSCPAGQAIQVIQQTGTVTCVSAGALSGITAGEGLSGGGSSGSVTVGVNRSQATLPRPGHVVTTVGTGNPANAAAVIALTIAGDGLPVILYRDSANVLALKRCLDLACTIQGTGVTLSTGALAQGDLTTGANGLPLIVYRDATSHEVRIRRCQNAACDSATETIVETLTASTTLLSLAVAVDSAGRPVVAYIPAEPTQLRPLKLARCDATCAAVAIQSLYDGGSTAEFRAALTIGAGGYPVVAYREPGTADLKVVTCDDAPCSGKTVVSLAAVDVPLGITIGVNGFPLLAVVESGSVKVTSCSDTLCTGNPTPRSVDSGNTSPDAITITTGLDGIPIIVARKTSTNELHISRCYAYNCAGGAATQVIGGESVGGSATIAIGVDGLPIVAYNDATNGLTRLLHCGNAGCVANNRPR